MSILAIGVNRTSGPLNVLERVAIGADELPKAVENLARRDNVREVAVISTCNRTEIYAVTERFHGAYADIRDFLCELGGMSADDLHPHLFSEHDDSAVAHLFAVAAGLDSSVIGDTEILGQIRDAWDVAQRAGGTRSTLNLLFRHAIGAGKRARAETGIARGTASVSHAAVEMALEHHGAIEGRRVGVLGAGAVGEGIAVALRRAGADEIVVVNRSPERGRSLAERVDGVAVGIEHLGQTLATADVVLTGTGAGQPMITSEVMSGVDRAGRPLLLVDIAVPRDVAPDVAELPGVTVLDLDDLAAWAERGRAQRLDEVPAVRSIIAESLDRFALDAAALQAAPLVAALRERAESLRAAELTRHAHRLEQLDPEARELLESITRGVVAKLLHEPSVRLRNQAGSPRGERNAAAVADLFDLG